MGRRTRGRDLWSGLALQGSFFVVPGSPVRVLWEMLWECFFKLGSSSHKDPGGLFQTYMDSHPLRAYDFHRGLRRSHFHCGSGTFDFLVVLVRPR